MSRRVTRQRPTKRPNEPNSLQTKALPTLRDHIRELQSRLFIVAIAFIGFAGLAMPYFDELVHVVLAPLRDGQELVYLTPAGAFNFMLKICAYVGIIGALPVIIFHLYRFLMPAVKRAHLRTALKYTVISVLLAIVGIIFAYAVSLPASLYFLTNFNLNGINPMLTIDSYLSFVMTYIVAGAALFQLPLLMTIYDSAKPLKPRKLMGAQRHIIVGSFVVAAIISPTPDALNQTILASPIIVMYQVGVAIIAHRRSRERRKSAKLEVKAKAASPALVEVAPEPLLQDIVASQSDTAVASVRRVDIARPVAIARLDGVRRQTSHVVSATTLAVPVPVEASESPVSTVGASPSSLPQRSKGVLSELKSPSTGSSVGNVRSFSPYQQADNMSLGKTLVRSSVPPRVTPRDGVGGVQVPKRA